MDKKQQVAKLKELLTNDLINARWTHENAPPHKDCVEECGLTINDTILSSNPVASPMRSSGRKHRKCMDCWNEYIDNLVFKIDQIYQPDPELREKIALRVFIHHYKHAWNKDVSEFHWNNEASWAKKQFYEVADQILSLLQAKPKEPATEPCPECDGFGNNCGKICPACNGTGSK